MILSRYLVATAILPFIPEHTFHCTQLDSCFLLLFEEGDYTQWECTYVSLTHLTLNMDFLWSQVNIRDLLFKT